MILETEERCASKTKKLALTSVTILVLLQRMQVAIPIYAVVEVMDSESAQRAKVAIEQLLKNSMVKIALTGAGVHVKQMTVGEPYPCQNLGSVHLSDNASRSTYK